MASKAMTWLEESFAPALNKVSRNIWVETIKDSIMQVLPLILVGSVVTMLAILQEFIPNFPNMWTFSSYSMGLIGLFVAFLIPFNYMERKKLAKMRIVSGMTGVCLFALIIRLEDITTVDYSALGAGGMIVAIVVGVIVARVMSLFANFSLFSKNSAIPDFVRFWFDAIIPIVLLLAVGWVVVYLLNFNLFAFIQNLFRPLASVYDSLGGFVLIFFIWIFLYSMGISTWVLTPITAPFMYAGIQANMDAVAAGLPATHIFTWEVYGLLALGGLGSTLPLVIRLVFSKSMRLKSLGLASLAPSILNINEPVVFGCIAWNPIMMVGIWIQGIAIPFLTYISIRTGLVKLPQSVFGLWYCPGPVSSGIVSGLSGVILFAVLFAVSWMLWWPFF
ncbi:MAG: PTS transporter subunit EIIC, partial [Treponema sp.]|nr:PTS transporter subunit EIIC [Treponema sp.]